MLIESVPKEPLSFHVVPFDCPRLQYTFQVSLIDCLKPTHYSLECFAFISLHSALFVGVNKIFGAMSRDLHIEISAILALNL